MRHFILRTNAYSFGKSIFFYLTPLLGQQISAAVMFAGFRHDFILLTSFCSSVLYNLKSVLARMEISDIKLFSLFLFLCQSNKYYSDHPFSS